MGNVIIVPMWAPEVTTYHHEKTYTNLSTSNYKEYFSFFINLLTKKSNIETIINDPIIKKHEKYFWMQ